MTRSVRRKLEISVKQKGDEMEYEGSVQEHKVYRFQVEAVPATVTVEVKYDGSHVRGSPYCQPHVEEKAEDLMKDLSVEMDGNHSPGPSLVSDRFISTSSNLQTTDQRKDPGSNRSVDVSGRGVWKQQMIIKSVSGGGRIDGAQGVCVLRSGNIVVADRKDQVLMFDSDGKFVKNVLGEQGRGFTHPGDMTRLHNGDFVLKVGNEILCSIKTFCVSRTRLASRSSIPLEYSCPGSGPTAVVGSATVWLRTRSRFSGSLTSMTGTEKLTSSGLIGPGS